MTELIFIFLQICLLTFIFSLNTIIFNNRYQFFSLFENICVSVVLHANMVLFLSFFNLNLSKIVNIYIFIISILILFNLYKPKKFISFFDYKQGRIYFLLFLCVVIFLDIANNASLSWDAEKFWFLKVLNFYDNNPIENLSNVANSHYPHLGSLLWTFFWKISLIDYEYSGRLFFGFIFIISILCLVDLLKTNNIYKFVISIFCIFISYDYDIVFSGNQEVLIFSFLSIAMSCFYHLTEKKKLNENFYLILILMICNLLIWTKQEGAIYAFFLILTLLFCFKLELQKKIIIFTVYFSLLFIRLFINKFYNFEMNLNYGYNDFSILSIVDKISFIRIILILKYFLLAFLKNYLLAIGFLIFILSFIDKKIFIKSFYIYFFAVANFSFIFFISLLFDGDLIFLLKTSLDRLIYSISPFIFLLIINYINHYKKN
jgi:hypothetical protein